MTALSHEQRAAIDELKADLRRSSRSTVDRSDPVGIALLDRVAGVSVAFPTNHVPEQTSDIDEFVVSGERIVTIEVERADPSHVVDISLLSIEAHRRLRWADLPRSHRRRISAALELLREA